MILIKWVVHFFLSLWVCAYVCVYMHACTRVCARVYVYACTCVPVYMCMCVHTRVCAHALIFCGCLGGQRMTSSVIFSYPSNLFFWERLSRSPCIRLDWLPVNPGIHYSASSAGAPGIIPRFLCGHCGSELRSPWLHSNSPTIPDLKLWLLAKIKAKWEFNLLVVQLTLKNALKQN